MSPDDHGIGSTSEAQPSHCTGELSEEQTADAVCCDTVQSDCLVSIAASASFPREAVQEKVKTVPSVVPAASFLSYLPLSGRTAGNVASMAPQDPCCSLLALLAGTPSR